MQSFTVNKQFTRETLPFTLLVILVLSHFLPHFMGTVFFAIFFRNEPDMRSQNKPEFATRAIQFSGGCL